MGYLEWGRIIEIIVKNVLTKEDGFGILIKLSQTEELNRQSRLQNLKKDEKCC